MAKKLDFKKFYEETKITEDLISYLDFNTQKRTHIPKEDFIEFANISFGMLAHLKVVSNEDSKSLLQRLEDYGVKTDSSSTFTYILSRLNIRQGVALNPTAIPTIQRYRTLFDAYEKQNGIQHPFDKKSGKEPGDN